LSRLRAGLTGRQQRDILAFLQASNNPTPLNVSAAAVVQKDVGAAISGKQIYRQTCVACHGADGRGRVPGTPDFTVADGPLTKPDDVLLQHITQGFQTSGSPMAMPAMGGNPSLSPHDVRSVLGYLRETFGSR
jgi:mono/diheme cytochrome c family protein